MRCLLLSALFAGCRSKPAPVVADLHFPVVVLYGTYNAVQFANATELGEAKIGNLNALTGPPPLIDSNFDIYTLKDLASTHNGLWLMTHPTGSTPVTFKLERASPTGIETTRSLLRARLDQQTWRDELEAVRAKLDQERSLAGMMEIVYPKSQ